MSRKQNNYTEEFRKNVVAVIKSGLSQSEVARRLNIPPNTICGWMKSNKYLSVPAAGEELIKALPGPAGSAPLVKIHQEESEIDNKIGCVRINCGKLNLELPSDFDYSNINAIVKAFKDNHVL